jgi:putative ABC transport system permease protein
VRVCFRWIRANLRARRYQAALSAGVVAGVVSALIVGLTLLEGTLNPGAGVFARSNGAQVWINTTASTQVNQLSTLDNVTALAGPYLTSTGNVVLPGSRPSATLRAMGPQLPSIGKPLVVDGHWLSTRSPRGVVLERTFAAALGVRVGSPLRLQGINGQVHTFTVTGTADTSDQAPFADGGPGLVMMLHDALVTVAPDAGQRRQLVGLRLSDSGADGLVAQQAVAVLPPDSVVQISKWHDVKAAMATDNRLLGLFLALFGAVGLISAAMAIANTTSGWVLSQLQDLAVLKVVGLTPRQVMRLLLLEQGALGLAGIGLGVLGAKLVTGPWVTGLLSDSVANKLAVPISTGSLLLIALGTAVVLMVAALLPAWRGSRVTPVTAVTVTPPRGRLSPLARVALLAHLPPALVLGARDTFTRRTTAILTMVALAVPATMVTIGLGCLATLDTFQRHPAQIGGLAGTLNVTASNGLSDAQATGLIKGVKGVAAVYPSVFNPVLLPGQARVVRARAIGDSRRPYPFPITQGRLYHAPGEAVAGEGLLRLMHAHVGERISVRVPNGVQMNLHIVGRTLEPSDNGEVLSFGLDTLNTYEPSQAGYYTVTLDGSASPSTVQGRLHRVLGNAMPVKPNPNPVDGFGSIRVLVWALITVLVLIGLANLLTATSVELRDHERNAGVLRAIGLTPRQVVATMVTRTVLLASIAVVAGVAAGSALGPWLIDLQGDDSGVGAGIGRAPSPLVIALTVLAALLMAAATALVPARRVTGDDVTAALYGRRPVRPGRRRVERFVHQVGSYVAAEYSRRHGYSRREKTPT